MDHRINIQRECVRLLVSEEWNALRPCNLSILSIGLCVPIEQRTVIVLFLTITFALGNFIRCIEILLALIVLLPVLWISSSLTGAGCLVCRYLLYHPRTMNSWLFIHITTVQIIWCYQCKFLHQELIAQGTLLRQPCRCDCESTKT